MGNPWASTKGWDGIIRFPLPCWMTRIYIYIFEYIKARSIVLDMLTVDSHFPKTFFSMVNCQSSVGFPTHVSLIYTNSAIINQLHQQSSTINPSKSHLCFALQSQPRNVVKKNMLVSTAYEHQQVTSVAPQRLLQGDAASLVHPLLCLLSQARLDAHELPPRPMASR